MKLSDLIGTAARIAALWDISPLVSTIQGYNTPIYKGDDAHVVEQILKQRGTDCKTIYLPEADEWMIFKKN